MTKPYAELTVPERWQWHAEIYALRRVLGIADGDETRNPCDPDGLWFDAPLVDAAERRLRESRRRVERNNDDVWEAQEVKNNWCRARGYESFNHYLETERIDYIEGCCRIAMSIVAGSIKSIPE